MKDKQIDNYRYFWSYAENQREVGQGLCIFAAAAKCYAEIKRKKREVRKPGV